MFSSHALGLQGDGNSHPALNATCLVLKTENIFRPQEIHVSIRQCKEREKTPDGLTPSAPFRLYVWTSDPHGQFPQVAGVSLTVCGHRAGRGAAPRSLPGPSPGSSLGRPPDSHLSPSVFSDFTEPKAITFNFLVQLRISFPFGEFLDSKDLVEHSGASVHMSYFPGV